MRGFVLCSLEPCPGSPPFSWHSRFDPYKRVANRAEYRLQLPFGIPPQCIGDARLMGIQVYCPNGHRLNLKAELAGRVGICPQCQSRFQIPDSPPTEQSPAPKIRTTPVASVAATPTASHDAWYLQVPSGARYGPVDHRQMDAWVDEGRVSPEALIWQVGWPEWKRADEHWTVARPVVPVAAPSIPQPPTVNAPATSASVPPNHRPRGPSHERPSPSAPSPAGPVVVATSTSPTETRWAHEEDVPPELSFGATVMTRRKRETRNTAVIALIMISAVLVLLLTWLLLRTTP